VNKAIAAVFLLFGILLFLKPYFQKPIVIPQEDTNGTSGWKEYKNSDYRFSFKYPEGLLSNFSVNNSKKIDGTLQLIDSLKSTKNSAHTTTYNVFFEANGWKFDGTLDEFIKQNLHIKNAIRQKIQLGKVVGLRVSNLKEKADSYYYYNLFQHGDYIYNFAIFADNADEVRGNTKLLDDIIGTAKFY